MINSIKCFVSCNYINLKIMGPNYYTKRPKEKKSIVWKCFIPKNRIFFGYTVGSSILACAL